VSDIAAFTGIPGLDVSIQLAQMMLLLHHQLTLRNPLAPAVYTLLIMHYALLPPPGKNWPQAFHKRHPELKPKKVKALDWNRHDNNIYDKITHWFEVIGKELCDPVIAPENVYNMDETGVMLSMLGSIKVLVGKNDREAIEARASSGR